MRPTANHYDYNHYHDDNDDDSEADHDYYSAAPTEEDHALQGASLRRNQESERYPVI